MIHAPLLALLAVGAAVGAYSLVKRLQASPVVPHPQAVTPPRRGFVTRYYLLHDFTELPPIPSPRSASHDDLDRHPAP